MVKNLNKPPWSPFQQYDKLIEICVVLGMTTILFAILKEDMITFGIVWPILITGGTA